MSETLRYLCQRCGNCCRWPGFVRLERGEEERIAAFLGLTPERFVNEFCELHPNRQALSIKSHPNGACTMLDGHNVCSIQPVKPRQCAGFPNVWNFPGWREVCEARDTWAGAAPPAAGVSSAGDA